MTMERLDVVTKRGVVLNGVLFTKGQTDAVVIAITGIHGNFYSNPFYYNIGDTLNSDGIDFIYAQTNDAFGQIPTVNVNTGKEEIIGSWNERFYYTDEDIDAYLSYAEKAGYKHIYLAGHSLGANKVIYYLSRHHDKRVEHFIFLSPANLTYMMSGVTKREAQAIEEQVKRGDGDKMLRFKFMGWVECIANTAYDWYFSGLLNNVHTDRNGDFSQAEKITHSGALLVGTYDNFTDGDPSEFLKNLNDYPPMSQPSLWCHWIINKKGELVWSGAENFYEYVKWLEYLIRNFFEPDGLVLSGRCFYSGERMSDWGYICVENNRVEKVPSDIVVTSPKENMICVRMPEVVKDELERIVAYKHGISLEQALQRFMIWCVEESENFTVWYRNAMAKSYDYEKRNEFIRVMIEEIDKAYGDSALEAGIGFGVDEFCKRFDVDEKYKKRIEEIKRR